MGMTNEEYKEKARLFWHDLTKAQKSMVMCFFNNYNFDWNGGSARPWRGEWCKGIHFIKSLPDYTYEGLEEALGEEKAELAIIVYFMYRLNHEDKVRKEREREEREEREREREKATWSWWKRFLDFIK